MILLSIPCPVCKVQESLTFLYNGEEMVLSETKCECDLKDEAFITLDASVAYRTKIKENVIYLLTPLEDHIDKQ